MNFILRWLRKPNPIKTGTDLFYQYSKPVEEWTAEDHKDWEKMIVKEPIEGLEDRVSHTVDTGKASTLYDYGRHIKEQLLTKPKQHDAAL